MNVSVCGHILSHHAIQSADVDCVPGSDESVDSTCAESST